MKMTLLLHQQYKIKKYTNSHTLIQLGKEILTSLKIKKSNLYKELECLGVRNHNNMLDNYMQKSILELVDLSDVTFTVYNEMLALTQGNIGFPVTLPTNF